MAHLLTWEPSLLVATTCPACSTPHAWNVTRTAPPAGEQVAHFLIPASHMWDDVGRLAIQIVPLRSSPTIGLADRGRRCYGRAADVSKSRSAYRSAAARTLSSLGILHHHSPTRAQIAPRAALVPMER